MRFKIFEKFDFEATGKSGVGIKCPRPVDEMIKNWTFECDDLYWTPANATATYPDENCRVVRSGSAGRVQQTINLNPGDYRIRVNVLDTNSSAFVLAAPEGGSSSFPIDFAAPGVHETLYTVTTGGRYNFGVGVNNPDGSFGLFEYLSILRLPSWWKIDTLDNADILGAWDFGWGYHQTRDDAFQNLVGDMGDFTVEAGDPGWTNGSGVSFGGSGCIKAPLPDVQIENLSVVIQFSNGTQNGTLDALFSHYLADSHFTLQNNFNTDMVRWSCGDGDSETIEITGKMLTSGVYGVSGTELYANAEHLGTIPPSGSVTVSGINFYLGALFVGNLTQFSKMRVQKLLIVKRKLTAMEHGGIYNRIMGLDENAVTHNGELVTYEEEEVTYG